MYAPQRFLSTGGDAGDASLLGFLDLSNSRLMKQVVHGDNNTERDLQEIFTANVLSNLKGQSVD
jgi:hypothetical protein